MLNEVWAYSLVSVFIVSVVSLIGVVTLSANAAKMKIWLIYLVSFSAGALFGDAFLHLLPEVMEQNEFRIATSGFILFGIFLFFVTEKIIHFQHYHSHGKIGHIHSFAIMNLIGDGFHNFLDGMIIGASYLVSIPVGTATTVAVVLHEIPQEIGDFGVLLHGGFSKSKALLFNMISALTSVLGAFVSLIVSGYIENIQAFIVPMAIGGFIYIAGSNLIPELHKEFTVKKAIIELLTFVLGVFVMVALLWLE